MVWNFNESMPASASADFHMENKKKKKSADFHMGKKKKKKSADFHMTG